MSTVMNDTIGTAKGALGTAAGGAAVAAATAKTSLMDVAKLAFGAATTLSKLGIGPFGWIGLGRRALSLVGLTRRRSPIGTLALIGTGVAIGAGAAVLLTPESGPKVRGMIARRFRGVKRDAVEQIEKVGHEVKDLEHEVEAKVTGAAKAVKSTVEGAAEQVRDAVMPESGASAKDDRSADAGRGEAQKSTVAQGEARRGHSFS